MLAIVSELVSAKYCGRYTRISYPTDSVPGSWAESARNSRLSGPSIVPSLVSSLGASRNCSCISKHQPRDRKLQSESVARQSGQSGDCRLGPGDRAAAPTSELYPPFVNLCRREAGSRYKHRARGRPSEVTSLPRQERRRHVGPGLASFDRWSLSLLSLSLGLGFPECSRRPDRHQRIVLALPCNSAASSHLWSPGTG